MQLEQKKTDVAGQNEGLGRSRGGFSSKIHALVDALGNPINFIITGGEVHDVTQGSNLIAGRKGNYILGDKSYDSKELIEKITETGAIAVIPSRSNSKQPRNYDKHIYKDRNLVERFFNKIKQFRRVATRYEKTIVSFMAMVTVAATMILLK
jgi:transposase